LRIRLHYPRTMTAMMITCAVCSRKQASRNELKCHIAVEHLHFTPYRCELCPYQPFPTEQTVVEHCRILHQIASTDGHGHLFVRKRVDHDTWRKKSELHRLMQKSLQGEPLNSSDSESPQEKASASAASLFSVLSTEFHNHEEINGIVNGIHKEEIQEMPGNNETSSPLPQLPRTRLLNKHEKKIVLQWQADGLPLETMAAKLGVRPRTLIRFFNSQKKMSDEQKGQALELHRRGVSYRQIGLRLGFSWCMIRKFILRTIGTESANTAVNNEGLGIQSVIEASDSSERLIIDEMVVAEVNCDPFLNDPGEELRSDGSE